MTRSILYSSLAVILTVGMAACGPAAEDTQLPAVDVATEMNQLYADFDEEYLILNPLSATFRGDNRFNDKWYPHDPLSDEYAAAWHEMNTRFLEKLQSYDSSAIDGQDLLSYEIFQLERQNAIERHDSGYDKFESLTPISQFFSMPSLVVMLGSGAVAQPFKTPEDYDNWIARSSGFLDNVDLSITRMREGVELGVVQPRILMEKALPQLAAQVVDDPEKSDFWGPITRMPESFSAADRERIEVAYRKHILETLAPAYAKLHDYIAKQYLQNSRETIGQSDLPGGEDYYAFMVRESTTTSYTPQEVHDIGKREAERIFAEMERIKDEVGFDGDMQEFFVHLRTDPKYFYDNEQDLLDGYDDLRATIDPTLDKSFDVKAKAPYIVLPVEPFRAESMAAAQYFMGTPDGSRPGIFYVNTFALDSRPNYVMEALSLHEASPGHHFQISIAQEMEALPAFRKFGGYTAFSEGWGLYAESLGHELGLYTDPMQYLGALYFDIWRANRLVVDTGMHAMGWSREDAIEWMQGNSPITDVDVVAEVERYIAIPSQALAYKVGQLKIRELRTRAEDALGDGFYVRQFHNEVLTSGSLPLFVLESKIDRWIESQLN